MAWCFGGDFVFLMATGGSFSVILRSVLTEMEKPFCEEDCPGPLPLPRRAHTDHAEIIRQRRREYGALPVEETPHLSLNWIGYFPCRAISRGAQHRTGCSSCVARAAVYLLSRLPRGNWALFPPPSSQDHLRIWRGPRGQLSSYFHRAIRQVPGTENRCIASQRRHRPTIFGHQHMVSSSANPNHPG